MQSELKPHRKALFISLMSSAFLVTACGGGGGGQSTDAAAPAPTSATASAPAGTVAGYRVYYGTASRSYSQAFGSGTYVTTTTSTLSGLPSGNTYYFAVTAVDAAGVESDYSAEASKLIP